MSSCDTYGRQALECFYSRPLFFQALFLFLQLFTECRELCYGDWSGLWHVRLCAMSAVIRRQQGGALQRTCISANSFWYSLALPISVTLRRSSPRIVSALSEVVCRLSVHLHQYMLNNHGKVEEVGAFTCQ